MSYFVYVLRSLKDGRNYVGSSADLDRRLGEHNAGSVTSTKDRRPFKLVYKEEFADKASAEIRERYFKTGKGRITLGVLLKS